MHKDVNMHYCIWLPTGHHEPEKVGQVEPWFMVPHHDAMKGTCVQGITASRI